MRISELGRRTGVAVPTLKYYLREGLLAPGMRTAPNQADYAEPHVRRVRLIRLLREVGGLGIEALRAVVAAIEDESRPAEPPVGIAHRALGPPTDPAPTLDDVAQARVDVDRFLGDLGWDVSDDAPARGTLAEALVALRRLGRDVGPEVFSRHAWAADRIAEQDLASVPLLGSRAQSVEQIVVGTVVFEAAFVALRRLAQERRGTERVGAG